MRYNASDANYSNRKQVHSLTNGVEKIGDTLFINGTPHVACIKCGKIVKKYDGNGTIVAGRDKKSKELREYKVTVLVKWLREDHLIHNYLTNQVDIETKTRPIVRSGSACFDCWNAMEDMKAVEKRRASLSDTPLRQVFFEDYFKDGEDRVKKLPQREMVDRGTAAKVDKVPKIYGTQANLLGEALSYRIPQLIANELDPETAAKAFALVGHLGRLVLKQSGVSI